MKKPFRKIIIGVIFLILIIGTVLVVKFFPVSDIEFLRNSSNPISGIICTYSVEVSGESMKPFFQPNATATFNKCFDDNELGEGTVIVYKVGTIQRLGIIRSIQNIGRLAYKVSNEAQSQELIDVLPDEIIGINELDTSSTLYIPSQKNSIPTELSDYMSEAYLGTIPRGAGLEFVKIRTTTTFNLSDDKFCYIVNPTTDLDNVDIEIWEKETDSITISMNDIIYTPGENINCDDMPLELGEGEYIFKIFVKNALIIELPFQITEE